MLIINNKGKHLFVAVASDACADRNCKYSEQNSRLNLKETTFEQRFFLNVMLVALTYAWNISKVTWSFGKSWVRKCDTIFN